MTNNTTTPKTTDTAPVTTPVTTKTTTETTATTKCRVFGSMQHGVDTTGIHFKSVLELRREFGDNWM